MKSRRVRATVEMPSSGGRRGNSIVSASETIRLKADCTAARIDMELAIPRMIRTPAGEIDNLVSVGDRIFGMARA